MVKMRVRDFRRLYRDEVVALYDLIGDAAGAIQDIRVDPQRTSWQLYEHLYEAFINIPVVVEMPLGELFNVGPVAWMWNLRNMIHVYRSFEEIRRLTKVSGFNMQGIEGVFCVEGLNLNAALNLLGSVPVDRVLISVSHKDIKPYLRRARKGSSSGWAAAADENE